MCILKGKVFKWIKKQGGLEAMKEKNEIKKNTIMMVRSAILQVEKDTQKELSENEIIEIISKELKKNEMSINYYH